MRVLLDSCTFVWYDTDPSQLSPLAYNRVTDPGVTLFLSVGTIWELVVKQKAGRSDAPKGDIPATARYHVGRGNLRLLPLELDHVGRLPTLPDHHRDPWDRMLICQSLAERLTILTPDKLIHQYPVAWEW